HLRENRNKPSSSSKQAQRLRDKNETQLVCVAGRLVVVGKRNQRCADAVQRRTVHLHVRVLLRRRRYEALAQRRKVLGNQQVVLLLLVHVLDDALRQQVVPADVVRRERVLVVVVVQRAHTR